MAALSKEITAYERMSEDIEAEHRGRCPLIWTDVSVDLPGLSSVFAWTNRSARLGPASSRSTVSIQLD